MKNPLQKNFFYIIFAFFVFLILRMMYPYANIFLWTALLYVLLLPFYRKLVAKINPEKKFYNGKRHFLGGAFAIGTFLLIIVPLSSLAFLLIRQFASFLSDSVKFLESNPDFLTKSAFVEWLNNFSDRFGIDIPDLDMTDLRIRIISFLKTYSAKIFEIGRSVAGQLGNFILSVLFMIFALYFCFVDGQYLVSVFSNAVPIKPEYMKMIISKFSQTTRSLFSGYILVALYQGFVAWLIMFIFGIKGSLLFSVLLMFASFIPMFGAALVWCPIGIFLCFTASPLKGILFLILSGVCISFLDNFLRPMFLKDRIHVHPLIIFFSILGGLKVFNLNGLILGPIIVIIFFTLLDILNNKDEFESI